MEQLLTFIEKFGLPVVLLSMFIIWAYNKDKRQEGRYDELGKRLDKVQDEQHKDLLEVSRRAITVQAESNKVQKELCEILHNRPCIAGDRHV